ncbi:MAG: Do family serine endopeptidase [Bacteroidetes bacterium]|nr:MAG: Do family serine endopeptidase [Bacteroidota bacterium]REK08186.1 MAG: Do family serine endopeptidase [Bacteroidota bacterium]REK32391.1 MAG: Do family serine endopeptidase [Bacteroidota bacterium]REK47443.1 MAG: Do family serine endopeptidase [Bacteroidota bacterium]
MKKTFGTIMIALLGGIGGALFFSQILNKQTVISTKNSSNPNPNYQLVSSIPTTQTGALVNFTKAAEMSVNSVVHVRSTVTSSNYFYNPFMNPFDYWGRPRQAPKQESSGSGVILTEDGYVVTNNHVVEKAEKIEVILNDNRTYTAKMIGSDASTDLALLKIDEKDLPYIVYGNSDELKVGEWVVAVGNPFNLTSTVTAGIVSAKARNIGILPDQYKIESFIQTDAAVNPGNSGGALVDIEGRLVGINTAIASNTGSYTGYSFAIPVNLVRKVMDDLVEFGSVQRGFIGVSIRDLDSKLADEAGIKEIRGVYIAGITPGGSAEDAGLREGDIITQIGDVSIASTPQLQEQVGRYRPGDKIRVKVNRKGDEKYYTLTLKNKDGDTRIVKSDQVLNILGGTFENVKQEESAKLGINGGVKIAKLNNGKLRAAGIREGFIITSIDKKPIKGMEDLENTLKSKQGGVLIEGVYPNGIKAYYGFGI